MFREKLKKYFELIWILWSDNSLKLKFSHSRYRFSRGGNWDKRHIIVWISTFEKLRRFSNYDKKSFLYSKSVLRVENEGKSPIKMTLLEMISNTNKRYIDLRQDFYDLKNKIRQICIRFISLNRLKKNNWIETITRNSIIFQWI